jgi:hypothetical protein
MINKELIAPCGMNCGVCKAHLRDKDEKNYCRGCRKNPVYVYCYKCLMRQCPKCQGDFCDCANLPCPRLKQLDKRYRTKYDMSMVANLKFIQKHGLNKFLKQQNTKYISKKGVFCVHDKKYHK